MAGIDGSEQGIQRHPLGIVFSIADGNKQLIAHPHYGGLRKIRPREQHIEHRGRGIEDLGLRQAANAERTDVAIDRLVESCPNRREGIADRIRRPAAGAFGKQQIGEFGQARFIAVTRTAGGKADPQIDHRQLMRFDEKDPRTVIGLEVLDDRHGRLRRRQYCD